MKGFSMAQFTATVRGYDREYTMNIPDSFPVFVALERTERGYGGPEEGGWYYDSSRTYPYIREVYNESQMIAECRKIIENNDLRQYSGRNPSRWDSGACADDRLVVLNRKPTPEHYDRPHYE